MEFAVFCLAHIPITVKSKNFPHQISGFAIIAFLILLFAYNFNHGERIQHQDGLGWDGAAYADWAQRDSLKVLQSKAVPSYYVGRLLPSFFIHHISRLLHYDIQSTPRIIHAFYIYNFCLLLLSGFFLWLIGKYYRWRLHVYFLAGTALFINYPVLKNASYNPTLVDISAFTVGLALFYFYLKDRLLPLFITSLIGCFVWPTIQYGALLFLFFGKNRVRTFTPNRLGTALSVLAPVCILAFAGYLYFVEHLRQTVGTTPIRPSLLPICVIALGAYIFIVLKPLIDIPAFWNAVKKTQWFRAAIAVLLFIVVKTVIEKFSAKEGNPLTIVTYIGLMIQASLANPLVNAVAHAMHYGPFYLLALFLWREIADLSREEGLGLVLFVALFGVMSLGAESRQFINAWPVFAILVCEAFNRKTAGKSDWFMVYAMLMLALVVSRFWLRINVGQWTGDFQNFPDQMLYMYSGPWMSRQMYGVFLAITILCILTILSLLRITNGVKSADTGLLEN